jgi:glycosyltransferase involved in cell wall biosynthesis
LVVCLALARKLRRPSTLDDKDSSIRSVWMFNHYANSPDTAGGTRHYELASVLKENGWSPTIFATPMNGITGRFERPISVFSPVVKRSESGIPFTWLYSLPYRSNGIRRYANMLSFMLIAFVSGIRSDRPDIIIGSSPHLLTPLAATLVAKRHRVPFVLEIRDLWPESLIQLGLTAPLIIKPLWLLQRYVYASADAIICLTDGIVEGVLASDIPVDKTIMIPNAALKPAPLNAAMRTVNRERLGWNNRTVAIWIGAHGPANNLEVLVQAARQLTDRPELLIVFVGGGSAKPGLLEMAQDLDNVEFHAAVPKTEVQNLLRAADIGVIVHRNTEAVRGARPNKLFDYMAASLPIVLNLDGEARSLVEECNSGLFAIPESPMDLAKRIRQLNDDVSLRINLGRHGYDHVSTAHSREGTADILSMLLAKTMSNYEKRR